MGTRGDSVLFIFAVVGLPVAVAITAILAAIGVVILGFLIIPVLPVVAVVTIAVMAFKGTPAPAEISDQELSDIQATLEDVEKALAAEIPVTIQATVVDAEGVCPLGWSFEPGEMRTLNGKWSGPELCPRLHVSLSSTAQHMRAGDVFDGEMVRCDGRNHSMEFRLEKIRERELTVGG